MSEHFELDPRLEEFVTITEVADASRLAEPLVRRKYRMDVPDQGHQILALLRGEGRCWIPAFFVNYLPHREAMLIGGACTDGEVLRQLSEERQRAIHDAGGLMLQTVRYAEARFADVSVGTFGYCGDARSWSILEQCGYRRLDHPYLIVRWNRDLPDDERQTLVESVRKIGIF